MTQDNKKKDVENIERHVDLGIETLGLGLAGIITNIERLMNLVAQFTELSDKVNNMCEMECHPPYKCRTKVFGISVKTAVGRKPVIESFGNFKKTSCSSTIEEYREPLADVLEEDGEIRIYAEMPGISKEDIKLDLKESVLSISAEVGDRRYRKEIFLPENVKVETMTSFYSNGILEVKANK